MRDICHCTIVKFKKLLGRIIIITRVCLYNSFVVTYLSYDIKGVVLIINVQMNMNTTQKLHSDNEKC